MRFKPSLGLGLVLGIALSLPVSLMHSVWADKGKYRLAAAR